MQLCYLRFLIIDLSAKQQNKYIELNRQLTPLCHHHLVYFGRNLFSGYRLPVPSALHGLVLKVLDNLGINQRDP